MFEERIKKAGEVLAQEITGDCCLLDVPNHYNIGDSLIYSGELDFIKNYTNRKITYTCSRGFFNKKHVRSDEIILIHGGGNFGDVWPRHQVFKEEIVGNFMDNKIIILPSTVFFRKDSNLIRCRDIFSKHPNLVICARDARSEHVLRSHFPNNTILLVPDMALYMLPVGSGQMPSRVPKVLFLKRNDRELREVDLLFDERVHESDWPRCDSLLYFLVHMCVLKINIILDKVLTSASLDVYGAIPLHSRSNMIKAGIGCIGSYDLIVSTRLHGFILSYLLQKPCILIDNSYGKNSAFFETWFGRGEIENPKYLFASGKKDVKGKIDVMLKSRGISE